MVIQYTLCNTDLPYPVKFPYPVNIQELISDFILGLPYPVKDSILKSEYFLKRSNNNLHKSSGINDYSR